MIGDKVYILHLLCWDVWRALCLTHTGGNMVQFVKLLMVFRLSTSTYTISRLGHYFWLLKCSKASILWHPLYFCWFGAIHLCLPQHNKITRTNKRYIIQIWKVFWKDQKVIWIGTVIFFFLVHRHIQLILIINVAWLLWHQCWLVSLPPCSRQKYLWHLSSSYRNKNFM